MTPRELRKIRGEVGPTLRFCVAELEPGRELRSSDVARVLARLPSGERELEDMRFEIRHALDRRVSFAAVLGDPTLDDGVIGPLLVAVGAEISARIADLSTRRAAPQTHPFRDAPPRQRTGLEYLPLRFDEEAMRAFGIKPR